MYDTATNGDASGRVFHFGQAVLSADAISVCEIGVIATAGRKTRPLPPSNALLNRRLAIVNFGIVRCVQRSKTWRLGARVNDAKGAC